MNDCKYAVVRKYYNTGKVIEYTKKVLKCKNIIGRQLKDYILDVISCNTYEEVTILYPAARIKIF